MAMMKHVARHAFVAICLLSTALPACAEDTAPAKPPKWMPALTAEAIQRLSPKVDTVVVSQGSRVPVCSGTQRLDEVERHRALALDGLFYCDTLRALHALTGSQNALLKSFRTVCSIEGASEFKPPSGLGGPVYETSSVYLFDQGPVDAAEVLWNEFRSYKGTEVQRVREVDVLHLKVYWPKGSVNFYYWSPRPRVAVVVRGDKLLDDTARRWSEKDPEAGPFAWDLPEWESIGADATTWAIRRAADKLRVPGRINGVVLVIAPKVDPESVRLVWHGSDDPDSPIPKESFHFPHPDDYGDEDQTPAKGEHPRITVRVSLKIDEEKTLERAFDGVGVPFARSAPWGL